MYETAYINCPHCGNEDVYRIPRTRLVKMFNFLLPLRRYACYACLKNFYVREKTLNNAQTTNQHSSASS
ncbi:DNA-directed RNA polymerase subunit RPC12/RpoP [Mucilaginibacter terrae]|uniref:DNA-directed RNA polymerase subunit RPC12/RpoP n=1 Tax=Mucilaginibacter terrae TaxID=1955052 RepID=A0ABU3GS31_9SPHI|nr:DNA-directed RNA polymerase subunit RPC12/RpoP [Mucilaginibacter terrae]